MQIQQVLTTIAMEPLFEAKARVNEQLTLFNVYRLTPDKYRVELKANEDYDYTNNPPQEVILEKKDGQWVAENYQYNELGKTICVEIDVFNIGYGDLLGRIGDT